MPVSFEDIRTGHRGTNWPAAHSPTHAMVLECRDQFSKCAYMSAALSVWLRFLRAVNTAFIVGPLALGAYASWTLLTHADLGPVRLLVAVLAFFAGVLPAVYRGLKMDSHLTQCSDLAAEYKNLQDRFRQCANISGLKPFADFDRDFRALMHKLEAARQSSYTAPDWCFKRAQTKLRAGEHASDTQASGILSTQEG